MGSLSEWCSDIGRPRLNVIERRGTAEGARLTEEQIRDVLHASCVIPVGVPNPHGPLGLEQLADAVACATGVGARGPAGPPQVYAAVRVPTRACAAGGGWPRSR